MKCKVIQDLLPLYCDKLTSEESNELIEAHLHDCGDCTEIYEAMCKKTELPLPETEKDLRPLKKVKRSTMIRAAIGFGAGALLLGSIVLFCCYGVIPIHSDQLTITPSFFTDVVSSWEMDEDGAPTNVDKEEQQFLLVNFSGDCKNIRNSHNVQYEYLSDGSMISHYEITIYPVLGFPFNDSGENSHQFNWYLPVKDAENGSTLTVHCRDQEMTIPISELYAQAE